MKVKSPQWPFYQPEVATWLDLWIWAADGRFHIVPCKQFISGQAGLFLAKAGKANGRFIKAVVSKPMAVLPRPASPNGRFINNGRFIKALLVESQWPFYQARWPLYQGQWPLYQGRIKQQWPLYQG